MKLYTAIQAMGSILTLSATVGAYDVEFWGESNCAGTPLGTFSGGPSEGCQQLFVGEAEGVTITSAGAADDGTVVAFYSSNDCDLATAVAEGDNGCIAVDSFASAYMSFNVIQSAGQGLVKRSILNTSIETPYGYEHGKLATYANITYRWHQVASNGWRGIPPSEWDDHVHVKSYRTIDTSLSTPALKAREHARDVSVLGAVALHERSFIYASCNYVQECALGALESTGYYVGTTVGAFITGIKNDQGETDIWGFLNQPFVLALTINNGGAAIGGVVSALTSSKLTASSCSTANTDADTIVSIMTALSSANPERAIKAEISLAGGSTGTISMESIPDGQRGDGNTCGAPATDPSTS